MVLIEWSADYELGIKSIDEQHKKIVDIINKTYLVLISGNKDRHSLDSLLDELTDYAETHFKFEENLMRENNFELIEEHSSFHNGFFTTIAQQKESVVNGMDDPSDTSVSDLIVYLRDWLISHILAEDIKYVPIVLKRGNN